MSFSYSQFPEIDFPIQISEVSLNQDGFPHFLFWLCSDFISCFFKVKPAANARSHWLHLKWLKMWRFSKMGFSSCESPEIDFLDQDEPNPLSHNVTDHIYFTMKSFTSTMANLWGVPVKIWKRENISPGKSVKIIRAVNSTETQTHKRQPLIVSSKS